MNPPDAATRRRPGSARKLAGAAGIAAVLVVLSTRPTPAPDASAGSSESIRSDYTRIATELLCYCGCARQTLKDCTCGIAFGLRDEWEARLAKGESADAIIAAYLAEHGEQSRNVPPKSGLNLLAWFGPGIAILLAAGGTIAAILLWSSRGRASAPASAPVPENERSGLEERLRRELTEFDA